MGRMDTAKQACTHHWLIAPPSGPTSKGVCRDCGATREFRNHFTEEEEYQASAARPPKGFVAS